MHPVVFDQYVILKSRNIRLANFTMILLELEEQEEMRSCAFLIAESKVMLGWEKGQDGQAFRSYSKNANYTLNQQL